MSNKHRNFVRVGSVSQRENVTEMALTLAEKPTPIAVSDIVSVSYGFTAITDGTADSLGPWGHVVLKSGERVTCGQERGERFARKRTFPSSPDVWYSGYSGNLNWWHSYFDPEIVGAATPSEFFANGNWHKLGEMAPEAYRRKLEITFSGRARQAVDIQTTDGSLTFNPELYDGYVGFNGDGFGVMRVACREFTTAFNVVTPRVSTAAHQEFNSALIRHNIRLPRHGPQTGGHGPVAR